MPIDTTAILAEINATQQQVHTRSQGIANLAGYTDFSPTDRALIATLAEKYQQETEGLQLGHAFFIRIPLAINIEMWERMRDLNIEFLAKLSVATTYEEWRSVIQLAKEWFQLMREITRDDTWTILLDQGMRFIQVLDESGYPASITLSIPDSMVAVMDREIDETLAARALFVPEIIVATKMTLIVSEEEPI